MDLNHPLTSNPVHSTGVAPNAVDHVMIEALSVAFGKALQIAAQHPPTTRKQSQKTREALCQLADEIEAGGGSPLHAVIFRCIADGID